MRHGTFLRCGFEVGQRVQITSKRMHLDGMPGIVTGDCPGFVRVRIYIGGRGPVSVWAKRTECKP